VALGALASFTSIVIFFRSNAFLYQVFTVKGVYMAKNLTKASR
jgi:hypothetical protein